MNLISALGAYSFFENKPKVLIGYVVEDTGQPGLFRNTGLSLHDTSQQLPVSATRAADMLCLQANTKFRLQMALSYPELRHSL